MTYDNFKKKSLLKYNAILASYNSLVFFLSFKHENGIKSEKYDLHMKNGFVLDTFSWHMHNPHNNKDAHTATSR